MQATKLLIKFLIKFFPVKQTSCTMKDIFIGNDKDVLLNNIIFHHFPIAVFYELSSFFVKKSPYYVMIIT